MNVEYIKIENIFNYLPDYVRDNMQDDDQILSFTLQGFKKLNFPTVKYIRKIIFLEVNDHNAVFPKDLKKIAKIKCYLGDCPENIINSFFSNCECKEEGIEEITTNPREAKECTIYHDLFLRSDFYNNFWVPVIYKENFDNTYYCNDKVDMRECSHTYSVTTDMELGRFSFKEGLIALEYYTDIKDGEGTFLLPKEPIMIWEYLSSYVKTRYWENRAGSKDQGAMSMYLNSKKESQIYLTELRSKLKFLTYNLRKDKEYLYGTQKFLAIPQHIRNIHNNQLWKLK